MNFWDLFLAFRLVSKQKRVSSRDSYYDRPEWLVTHLQERAEAKRARRNAKRLRDTQRTAYARCL